METIFKYELAVVDEQYIEMPEGAIILDVQTQKGIPCIWVRVDTMNKKTKRLILIHGTGHRIDSRAIVYIGSFQLENGSLVFHAFSEYM